MRWVELFVGSIVFLGLAGGASWGDEAAPLVGRVSATSGPVQYHPATAAWSDALINEPVAAGCGLRTGADAVAAFRVPAVEVSLAPDSDAWVARLDQNTVQIAVTAGRIGVHLGAGDAPRTVEIDLPQGGVWLAAPGDYDVAAGDGHAPPAVKVFAGKARLGGGLDDGALATATADWFSDWWRLQASNAGRADHRARLPVPGIAALDEAGRWETDARLGDIWYPSDVPADWAPYRDGVWRFLPPWGWTWVDDAPWGFATSHYGRWARLPGPDADTFRWAWVPGSDPRAADYSPAVVAFLGAPAIGMSRPGDAGTAVAWFPLAPGETVGDGNEANFQNRRFATAVSRAAFAAGQPVAKALVEDVPRRRFADAPVILGALGILPTGAAPPAKKTETVAAAGPPAEAVRQPFVVALHQAPVRQAPARPPVVHLAHNTPLAHLARKRPRPAMASRARLASAIHSPHNRARLAAAHGGA